MNRNRISHFLIKFEFFRENAFVKEITFCATGFVTAGITDMRKSKTPMVVTDVFTKASVVVRDCWLQ